MINSYCLEVISREHCWVLLSDSYITKTSMVLNDFYTTKVNPLWSRPWIPKLKRYKCIGHVHVAVIIICGELYTCKQVLEFFATMATMFQLPWSRSTWIDFRGILMKLELPTRDNQNRLARFKSYWQNIDLHSTRCATLSLYSDWDVFTNWL